MAKCKAVLPAISSSSVAPALRSTASTWPAAATCSVRPSFWALAAPESNIFTTRRWPAWRSAMARRHWSSLCQGIRGTQYLHHVFQRIDRSPVQLLFTHLLPREAPAWIRSNATLSLPYSQAIRKGSGSSMLALASIKHCTTSTCPNSQAIRRLSL